MASVAQLVDAWADIMQEPRESVAAYARALIDAGDLPKSRGRAIAQVHASHVMTLGMVIALSPRIKDASETVRAYRALRPAGVHESAPAHLQGTAGDALDSLASEMAAIRALNAPPQTDYEVQERKNLFYTEITFVINWKSVEIKRFGFGTDIYKNDGIPSHWNAHFKTATIMTALAFYIVILRISDKNDYSVAAS